MPTHASEFDALEISLECWHLPWLKILVVISTRAGSSILRGPQVVPSEIGCMQFDSRYSAFPTLPHGPVVDDVRRPFVHRVIQIRSNHSFV